MLMVMVITPMLAPKPVKLLFFWVMIVVIQILMSILGKRFTLALLEIAFVAEVMIMIV